MLEIRIRVILTSQVQNLDLQLKQPHFVTGQIIFRPMAIPKPEFNSVSPISQRILSDLTTVYGSYGSLIE